MLCILLLKLVVNTVTSSISVRHIYPQNCCSCCSVVGYVTVPSVIHVVNPGEALKARISNNNCWLIFVKGRQFITFPDCPAALSEPRLAECELCTSVTAHKTCQGVLYFPVLYAVSVHNVHISKSTAVPPNTKLDISRPYSSKSDKCGQYGYGFIHILENAVPPSLPPVFTKSIVV
jgi:hypothetical protein